MKERNGGYETAKKVEIGGGIVAIVGLMMSVPILGVLGLLAVTGAEGYKLLQKGKNK